MTASAYAQVAREGSYQSSACYFGPSYVIQHSKEQMAGSYAATGIAVAPPADPFHDTAAQCYGSWTLVDGEYADQGSCEYTDPSGDRFFGVYRRKNQELGQWRVTGGTGKFAGMIGTGNWEAITRAKAPDGQLLLCNRHWGTWKLR
jgi:hypothetical protein